MLFSLTPLPPNGINKSKPLSLKNGQLGKIKIFILFFFFSHSVCGASVCFCGLLRQSIRELEDNGTTLILKHKTQRQDLVEVHFLKAKFYLQVH